MKVLKKLVAAALATSLPLAALAQTTPAEPAKPAETAPATTPPPAAPPAAAKAEAPKPPLVQVYGTLNLNLQYTEASGATNPAQDVKGRMAVSIDSSNIGVRGALDVSHGMKAVYQCETQASIDGEDTRALCNRNSRVGLQSAYGTLFYGNWDTPFKNGHYGTKADDPFLNTDVYGYNGIMGSPGYGSRSSAYNAAGPVAPATSVTTASFDQRAANSVAYWTPQVSGLSAKIQYSVDEFRSTGTGIVDPWLVAAVVNFDKGPLSILGAAEYHGDAFGMRTINAANTGLFATTDFAWRVAAGYDLPIMGGTLNVMGMFEQLTYNQDGTTVGFDKYSREAWLVGAKFRAGDHEFRARYSAALDPSITAASGTTLPAGAEDNLGATSYAVGYAYYLAKSTHVYASATEIMNDSRARYTFPVSGAANVVAGNTPAGGDLLAIGLGIRVAF
jgi:predicted porin